MQTAALLPTTEFVDSLEISGTGVPKSKLHCISIQAFLHLASEIHDRDLVPSAQRPKKSEFSRWQNSTRKNFPDEVRK